MMEKAGYLQQPGTGLRTAREQRMMSWNCIFSGTGMQSAEQISSKRFQGGYLSRSRSSSHDWNYYLGQTRGLAHVSASGKALNIELFENGNFTLSLTTLRAAVHGKERSVVIVKIPETPAIKIRRFVDGQQKISAVVEPECMYR